MSNANMDLDSEIINQARNETVGKYRLFIDEIYQDIANQNDRLKTIETCFGNLEPFKFLEQNARALENENTLIIEHTNYFELLQTCGNTQLNKLMLVFVTLTEELNQLSRSVSQFINPLILYREECLITAHEPNAETINGTCKDEEQEDEYTATATILPLLFEIICYLRRCYEVASNLVTQKHLMLSYASFKSNDRSFQSSIREVLPDLNSAMRFDVAWAALANLATALINLDQVFASQSNIIRRDIHNYKRSLEMVSKNLSKFDLDSKENHIKVLLTMLDEVQKELFDGRIAGPVTQESSAGQEIDFLFFRGLVISILNTNISECGAIAKNMSLNENMGAFVKYSCLEIEQNQDRFIDDHRLLAVASFYSLYFHLFWKDADRRLIKSIIDVQKKMAISFIHMKGNVSITPDQVLIGALPKSIIDKKMFDYFPIQREAMMKIGFMDGQVKAISVITYHWLVAMEQALNSGFYNESDDGDTLQLVFSHIHQWKEGFEHIRQLSNLVRNCIAIHNTCQRPVTKADTVALCKAINLLKGIQRFFQVHKKMLIEATAHYQKYNACALLNILTRSKRKILSNVNNYSEQKLDLLSAIILAANCLNGPVLTAKRFTLSTLCMAYAIPYEEVFTPDDLTKILVINRRIQFFINIFGTIRRMFDCEFLYFNRAIIQVYFSHFYESANVSNSNQNVFLANLNELQYFFAANDDALPLLESVSNVKQSKKLIASFVDEIVDSFKTNFLNPMCKDFEDELRFRTHSHLQVGDKSPFVRNLKDFHSFLSAEPFRLGGGRLIIWIKSYVENHLNELAYNMTTIALHDWKTYESMLAFARDKFGLEFASLQLPTQTLEQGLDVLEITRNIQIFVAAYMYNLNNQFFLERSSNNKHLNVLTIRHVSNSIQTHGFGIINSTVNYAYQFLKKKFQILSQFLFEEHIKSRLIKDIRNFRELIAKQEAAGVNGSLIKFPFERAEKFAKGIRRLGVASDGFTYLDKFRQLLTQIGNVLGFVRMLRSGALHCTSEIANFIPDLDDLRNGIKFEDLVRNEPITFNQETIEASQNFDQTLETICANYSDATDYFKLLVEVFASTMRDPKNMHLRNFFVVLPATTYNYVQHIIINKEKLARNNKTEDASFTDDGFAMGVIYVLKLLNQLNDFDSLQWFSSVDDHVIQAIQRSNSMVVESTVHSSSSNASRGVDDKLVQTTSLTIKRLEMFRREFQLLKYGMTSCRILFMSSN
ncbi:hypothetical protein BLOT_016329 [Blomia tropicalis]|nr:hypothetical protein BLOT_016329 [Blomia tropicalis]